VWSATPTFEVAACPIERWRLVNDRKIRWCWLELADVALMLQEFLPEHLPKETLGTGTSVCFL